jgi:hypothetical protein
MNSIEIKQEKVASSTVAVTPQVQVNPGLDRETQQREVISIDDDVVNTINSTTANVIISQMKTSPHKTTTHTSQDSSTMIDTNDALRNNFVDGTTQSFGTDVSSEDLFEKKKKEKAQHTRSQLHL